MLQKPSAGWTEVQIGNYKDRASYLTDIPNDCLDAAIGMLKNKKEFRVLFDAEGWEYIVCASDLNKPVWIETDNINDEEADGADLIVVPTDISPIDLFREIANDIEMDITGWITWMYYSEIEDEARLNREKEKLLNKIKELKQLIASV